MTAHADAAALLTRELVRLRADNARLRAELVAQARLWGALAAPGARDAPIVVPLRTAAGVLAARIRAALEEESPP